MHIVGAEVDTERDLYSIIYHDGSDYTTVLIVGVDYNQWFVNCMAR